MASFSLKLYIVYIEAIAIGGSDYTPCIYTGIIPSMYYIVIVESRNVRGSIPDIYGVFSLCSSITQ